MNFKTMAEAKQWLMSNASGECTVICHYDPYLCHQVLDDFWAMTRQYPTSFYLKEIV